MRTIRLLDAFGAYIYCVQTNQTKPKTESSTLLNVLFYRSLFIYWPRVKRVHQTNLITRHHPSRSHVYTGRYPIHTVNNETKLTSNAVI